ncbi:hypothetical protein CSUI_001059 [Cystoisospora suis]|uniref:Transmembrane protein n=1 Tax=Cystoisospora suis TaxID=483139 RepID=A0A2C6LE96_9APIC|nr:hypothetical protein CSUI_001059 [Cystoisospora suis]
MYPFICFLPIFCLSIYLYHHTRSTVYLCMRLSTCIYISLSVYLYHYFFVSVSLYLCIYIYLAMYLSLCISIYVSSCMNILHGRGDGGDVKRLLFHAYVSCETATVYVHCMYESKTGREEKE